MTDCGFEPGLETANGRLRRNYSDAAAESEGCAVPIQTDRIAVNFDLFRLTRSRVYRLGADSGAAAEVANKTGP